MISEIQIHSKEELAEYDTKILSGDYGPLAAKHRTLAKRMIGKTWEDIRQYVLMYRKYDEFTYRDIDKVYALACTL